jgi:predicted metalloendopeptidase
LDDTTRAAAHTKLSKLINLVGSPDELEDWSTLSVSETTYFENVMAARERANNKQIQSLGQPVDRHRWQMTASTVNAYYDPSMNEMVFPAAIIQNPFFDGNFPAAMNFGGIGVVMGHELTHGFDDQGSQFDGDGRFVPWWSDAMRKAFSEKADCLVKQYGKFTVPTPSGQTHLNGLLTLGENIADNGGVHMSYQAFLNWQKKYGEQPRLLSQYSNEQLFFIAFGQSWCENSTPQHSALAVLTDPHSPGRYRIQGPLSNFQPFSDAFKCKAGTTYNPDPKTRCKVW